MPADDAPRADVQMMRGRSGITAVYRCPLSRIQAVNGERDRKRVHRDAAAALAYQSDDGIPPVTAARRTLDT